MSVIIRYFVVLFTLSIAIQSHGQDVLVVRPGQLDSLKQLIENSREDTNKVILLNEYAKICFYDLEYLHGLTALKKARMLSKKLKYRNGEIRYFKTISHLHRNTILGAYYLIISDWNSNEGIPVSAKTGASTHPMGVNDKDSVRIQKNLLLALDFFEVEEDKEIVANIYFALFENYRDLDSPEKASIYWDRAYNDFEALGQTFPQVLLLVNKIYYLRYIQSVDEARKLELKAINLIDTTDDLKLKGLMFFEIGNHYLFAQGRNNLALEYYLKSIDAFEEIEGGILYIQVINLLGAAYTWAGNDEKAVLYFEKDLKYYQELVNSTENLSKGLERQMVWVYTNIADPLIALNRFREADEYLELALPLVKKYNASLPFGRYYQFKAALANKQSKYDEGLSYDLIALEKFKEVSVNPFISEVSKSIAQHYQRSGDLKKGLQYGLEAYKYGLESSRAPHAIEASLTVSELYEQAGQTQKSNEFLKIHLNLRDENDAINAAKRFEDAELRSLLESQNREIATLEKDRLLQEQERRNQRLWIISISGALVSAIILTIVLYRNNQNRKKANTILNQQKAEIEDTLSQLRDTQSQLIHSEKMASLGELTAGIAHEIQNPLNFVNNFSDVNSELIEELSSEAKKGNFKKVDALANDIEENENKILHHGQRADAIVKSMLQHSRGSSGEMEMTNINVLADEYLRLAYHGYRAKDKLFNVDLKTEFDESIPNINIVPQDIGQVLLNLINNAFYACTERSRSTASTKAQVQDAEPQSHASPNPEFAYGAYKPTVIVSTKKIGGMVEIMVKDNGKGIPDNIKDKIFQPFFTTKSSGEGTGLGLSLSYDIVTKGHGGELKLKSKEREGSEFIIQIPLT